jgi:hypothetical protein
MKSTPELKLPPLHPRFAAQIPDLINKAGEASMALRPAIKQAESLVAEVKGYLDFEIDKAVVAIQKADWEARSNTIEAKVKLEQLQTFQRWLISASDGQLYTVLGIIAEALTELNKEDPP